MDKIGYFRLLPRDLINELHKYFTDYFNGDSIISVIFDRSRREQSNSKNYLEFYVMEIFIKFSDTKYSNLRIDFKFQLPILNKFLDGYVQDNNFIFIDKNKLKLNRVDPNYRFKIDTSDITNAHLRRLTNKQEEFHVNLQYYLHKSLLNFSFHYNPIYTLTFLQSEVLIYKLVQLHNDIVDRKLKREY